MALLNYHLLQKGVQVQERQALDLQCRKNVDLNGENKGKQKSKLKL